MTDQFSPQFGEEYEPVPAGGPLTNRGYVGPIKIARAWHAGWADAEIVDENGRKYPPGNVFLSGSREDAEKFATTYLSRKFAPPVLILSVPVVAVCNFDEETRAKFNKSPMLMYHVGIAGLGKGNYYKEAKSKVAGYNLVTVPSIVDAYARVRGWYADPMFDVNWIGDIHQEADCGALLDKLADTRKAIWNALGEKDWLVNNYGNTTGYLAEALKMVNVSIKSPLWGRMHRVYDPSPADIYPTKKEGKDPYNRHYIPAVSQFFSGEREAVAVGRAEISESDSAGATGILAIWPNLSESARSLYESPETLEASLDQVKEALTKKPKQAVLAEFVLTMGDLKVLVDAGLL